MKFGKGIIICLLINFLAGCRPRCPDLKGNYIELDFQDYYIEDLPYNTIYHVERDT